jgi:VWFA-related protein
VVTMRIRKRTVLLLIAMSVLTSAVARAQDGVETIRIDSGLVDLRVNVLGFSPLEQPVLLDRSEFKILEDGVAQEISFFEAADEPFDLVLLLDVSLSNAKNRKLIRNSAKKFIEAARPSDRIAVVAFTTQPSIYSSFSLDRKKLKKAIDEIDEPFTGTNFWDSLDYVISELIPQEGRSRRSAVVVMSDGIDNALPNVDGPGSRLSFEKLVEHLRDSDSIVFPIYLDTEAENVKHHGVPAEAYAQARTQMESIAAACGTIMYRAAKIKDLDELYGKVVRDLSTVYSIGYSPTNRSLDGKWRSVNVQLVNRPGLSARTKQGYFAKSQSQPSP